MKEIQNTEDAGLRLLYQISVDDIRYAKTRQWTIIYYSLLTLAAITGFYLSTENGIFDYTSLAPKLALLIPAFAISILATWLLMETQKCLCEYRMRLEAIESKLPEFESLTAISSEKKREKRHRYSRYFWTLVFPFIILIMVGMLYIAWLLFRGEPNGLLIKILCSLVVAMAAFFFYFLKRYTSEVHEAERKLDEYRRASQSSPP